MLRKLLLFICITGLFTACIWNTDKPIDVYEDVKDEATQKAIDEIVATDRAFSEASAKEGMKKAFLHYVANEAVLLRPGYLPIRDADVIHFLNAQEDSSFVMTWEPKGAEMAKSLDLGYTFGVYKVQTKDTVLNGTYLSIWRKQKDGTWKFELDTGNPGIGEGEQDGGEKE